MAMVASLETFHRQGPPSDIGTFVVPTGIMVFQHTFSGTDYIVALRSGERGWIAVGIDVVSATNNRTVLNTALATGREVFVAQATYLLDARLNLTVANTVLEGEGWGTIFRLDAAADAEVIYVAADNCLVKDLQVDGNYLNQTGGFPIGIEVYDADNCTVEHCYVHDTYSMGIQVGHSSLDCLIHACYVSTTRESGILVLSENGEDTRRIIVSDCTIYNSGLGVNADNLYFCDVDDCLASNCTCNTATDCNFEIQAINKISDGNVVSGINCVTATSHNIFLDGATAANQVANCVIGDFYCRGSTGHGISLVQYVRDSEIGNGEVYDPGDNGIHLWTYITRCNFHDIHIFGCTDDGVDITTNSNSNSLVRIDIYDPDNRGIVLDTVHDTLVHECTLIDCGHIGIDVDNCNRTNISDNVVLSSTYEQLRLDGCLYSLITDNRFYNTANGYSCLRLHQSSYNIAQGNFLVDETANSDGIRVSGGVGTESDDNKIDDNYLFKMSVGVNIDANSRRTSVFDNKFVQCTTAVQNANVTTQIQGNMGNVGWYQSADYGAAWANWLANIVGTPANGTICVFWNSNAGVLAARLGCYANGAWRYEDLT